MVNHLIYKATDEMSLLNCDTSCYSGPGDLLDTSNWSTAFQTDSILASYDADCLELIFRRLSPADALHLGLTCRRLLGFFEESRRTTKAVEVVGGHFFDDMFNAPKKPFLRSIRNADERRKFPTKEVILNRNVFSSLHLHTFVKSFANLRYLEASIGLHPLFFDYLLTKLTSSLPLLTTLKLHLKITNYCRHTEFWHSLVKLQHPALQHLTLVMNTIANAKEENYQISTIPQLPILQQLTTFSFFIDGSFPAFYRLIRQLVLDSPFGAHLTPGVGALFGLQQLNNIDPFDRKPVPVEPELLAYLVYLNIPIGRNEWFLSEYWQAAMTTYLRCLKHMTRLKRVELQIGSNFQPTDYPSLLTALSSLAHLREIAVYFAENVLGYFAKPDWPLSMPVLPTVRVFHLKYNPDNHQCSDIVEQFHLEHCFPQLQHFKCHFWKRMKGNVDDLNSFQKSDLFVAELQPWGLEQSQRLLAKLPKTVHQKEVSFTFQDYLHFSSLEKLKAGKGERLCLDPDDDDD